MKKISILILVFLIPFLSKSQSESFIVKLDLTALVDPLRPAIQPGVEYLINDQFSVSGDVGFRYLPSRMVDRMGRMDNKYFRVEGEVRYYLNPDDENWFYRFCGLGTTYFDQKYFLENSRIGNVSFSRSDVSMKIFTVFSEMGTQFLLSEKWFLDYYMELGVRQYTVTHDFTNPVDLIEINGCVPPFCSLRERSPGNHLSGYFWLGLKLGYVIK